MYSNNNNPTQNKVCTIIIIYICFIKILWERVPTYPPPTWQGGGGQGGGMGAGWVTKRTCFLIGLFFKKEAALSHRRRSRSLGECRSILWASRSRLLVTRRSSVSCLFGRWDTLPCAANTRQFPAAWHNRDKGDRRDRHRTARYTASRQGKHSKRRSFLLLSFLLTIYSACFL